MQAYPPALAVKGMAPAVNQALPPHLLGMHQAQSAPVAAAPPTLVQQQPLVQLSKPGGAPPAPALPILFQQMDASRRAAPPALAAPTTAAQTPQPPPVAQPPPAPAPAPQMAGDRLLGLLQGGAPRDRPRPPPGFAPPGFAPAARLPPGFETSAAGPSGAPPGAPATPPAAREAAPRRLADMVAYEPPPEGPAPFTFSHTKGVRWLERSAPDVHARLDKGIVDYVEYLDGALGPEASAVLVFVCLGAWGPKKDLATARSPAAVLQAALHRSQAQAAARPALLGDVADLVALRPDVAVHLCNRAWDLLFTEFDERDSRRLVRDMLMTMPEERCQEDGARRAWLYNLLLHAV